MKFLKPAIATGVMLGVGFGTDNVTYGLIAGILMLLALLLVRRRTPEVTSAPSEDMAIHEADPEPAATLEPWLGVVTDGNDSLPPVPNMGQKGKRYRGPDYFFSSGGKVP